MATYKRGFDYPNEGFIQLSIEAHFNRAGFLPVSGGTADLLCAHPTTGERWHIEAKGQTAQIGLDFRTGLGQLVQAMRSETTKHGIAVPDTAGFRSQVEKLSPWVVERLGIHWIFVSENGDVRIIGPNKAG